MTEGEGEGECWTRVLSPLSVSFFFLLLPALPNICINYIYQWGSGLLASISNR